jgi:ATP-dependent Clp protease ATP-binding subunit ClpB
VVFQALQPEQIKGIVALILDELKTRLHNQLELNLTYSTEAVEYLATTGFDVSFGARPLKRLIVHTVETILGKKIVSGEIEGGDTVEVILKNGAIDLQKK